MSWSGMTKKAIVVGGEYMVTCGLCGKDMDDYGIDKDNDEYAVVGVCCGCVRKVLSELNGAWLCYLRGESSR